MPKARKDEDTEATPNVSKELGSELAKAIMAGIEEARPKRITIENRKSQTPWSPPKGVPKAKLKRKMMQHGIILNPKFLTNEEIELLNQIRPGTYCEGHITVVRRKDKGVSIEYPVKTVSQRMKLVSSFGLRNLAEICQRIIAEAENPQNYKTSEDLDF